MKNGMKRISACMMALLYGVLWVPVAQADSFNMIVPDVRQPATIAGGSACPA